MIWATAAVGIAGILGTFFGPWWQQRAAANRQRLANFRTAKRVVFSEIQDLRAQLEALRLNGIAPLGHAPILETPGWSEHRNVLADALSDDAWKPLADFFRKIVQCRGSVVSTPPLSALEPVLMALLPDAEATALASLYWLSMAEPVDVRYRAEVLRLPDASDGATEPAD